MRLSAVAVAFLALGIFGTLLVESPQPPDAARRIAAEADRLEREADRLEEDNARLRAEIRKLKSSRNPAEATPESLGAPRAVAWLKALDPERFGWLSADQAMTLREIDLSRKAIDPAHLEHLRAFPALARVVLSGSTIGDDGLAVLATLPDLRSLELQGTNVTDAGLETLAALPNLRTLDVRGTQVTKGALDRFGAAHADVKVWR